MSVEKLKELESTPVGRLLWKYSVPAVVGTLVMSTYNIIDRVFIGQGVGAEAIAGLAVTFPVMNISAALGTLIGVGAASRISIALGEKNHRLAEQILGNSLVLTVIIGILYISAIGLFLKDILLAFGANELTLPYAYDYMSVLLPGLLIINICYSFNNMMRTSGYPQKAMITMILGAVLNVTLDPIFIVYLDLGIKGASIATVISMTISAAFVMTHFINPNSILHFKRGTFAIDKAIFISIIGIGAAPFLVNVSGSAINAIVNQTLLRHGGYFAVGAVGIFSTYVQLIIMIIIGICQGVQPIIGYNFGAGHFDRLKHAFWLGVIVATAICFVGFVVGELFPEYIARAFTTDEQLIAVTINGLRLSLLAFSIVGFPIVATALFQSIGKAGESIFLGLARQVLFIIPLLLILPRFWQLDGAWLSYPLADVCANACTAYLVIRQFKKFKAVEKK